MLPNNTVRRVKKWIDDLNPPRDRKHPETRSFCSGGSDVGYTGDGITAYTWQAWTDGSAIYLQRADKAKIDKILADKNISSVSIAFDRKMNLIIAYQSGIESKLWVGRNGSLLGDVALKIKGGRDPKVALDDNRYATAGTSDVIFAYIKDSNLYCRYQRQKYQSEHLLQSLDKNTFLHRIGMGRDNRFLFLLKKQL